MEKLLSELVKRLQEAYGPDLVSVVLYGSAVSGDYQQKYSDLNLLCTLRQVGVQELRKGEKVINWWTKQKQPPPLLFSLEETQWEKLKSISKFNYPYSTLRWTPSK